MSYYINNTHTINPELIAYWFFRLNGCATINNFVVHPDTGGLSQRTDVDVLAVRFPYRVELWTSGQPMSDHPVFDSEKQIDICIAEVKHGLCRLNGPWTNEPDENMHRVLYAIGAFDKKEYVPKVAQSLYDKGKFIDDQFRVRIFAIGDRKNSDLKISAVQLIWDDILLFIHRRFYKYQMQKAHHNQWDMIGQQLFRDAINNTADDFVMKIKEAMRRYVESKNRPAR